MVKTRYLCDGCGRAKTLKGLISIANYGYRGIAWFCKEYRYGGGMKFHNLDRECVRLYREKCNNDLLEPKILENMPREIVLFTNPDRRS